MSVFSSVASILEKIFDWIPNRTERWKNEIDKLEKRQAYISIHKRNDLAREYERNQRRLQKLNQTLKNYAS